MAGDGQIPVRQVKGLQEALENAGNSSWWPGDQPVVDYDLDAAPVLFDGTTSSHLAFPNALTLRSGKQLVFFRSSTSHAVSTSTASVKARSRVGDDGAWSAAYTVLDTASVDDHTGGLTQLRDGTVVTLICERPSASVSTMYTVAMRSTDDGATFDAPTPVDAGYSGMSFASDLIVLADGRTLLAALYGTDGGQDYAVVAASTDGGETWARRAVIGQDGNDWQEPRLVLMPDGEILAFIRFEGGANRIYLTRSTDHGHTWTTPAIILTGAGGMPAPHLTRNGVLLLAYRLKDGSDATYWATSRDRGNTWTVRGNLAGNTTRYVYADWLDLASGDVAIVYGLENPPNGNSADLFYRELARTFQAATAAVALADVTHAGDDGDVVTVVDGVLTTAPPEPTTTATRWEAVLIGTPPEPVLNPAGDDWLYVEVSN